MKRSHHAFSGPTCARALSALLTLLLHARRKLYTYSLQIELLLLLSNDVSRVPVRRRIRRSAAKMAYVMRCGVGIFVANHAKRAVPRTLLPPKYKRLCFHTSWVLDGEFFQSLERVFGGEFEDGERLSQTDGFFLKSRLCILFSPFSRFLN